MVQQAVLWIPAGIYLLAAVLALWPRLPTWWLLRAATRLVLVTVMSLVALAAWPGVTDVVSIPSVVVLALVSFLGWIIGDYSQRYLQGEARQSHYVSAYLFTLASACCVIVAEHLLIQIVAWSLSSVGLHRLLTFYQERPAALLAARKKYLVSRVSELLMLGTAVLIWWQFGSFERATIAAQLSTGALTEVGALSSLLLSGAAVCWVLAVMLKTALMPTHGWLIQVMEAPTPVSALLHAGVVNLGGVVLIQWAPLLQHSMLAQSLLVIMGSLTAVIAGVVMLTRITIKVRLAWSTCSQMGLMIMECGLGLYDLALLHLLAHSLYKAHAFLTAGEAVQQGVVNRLVAQRVMATHPVSLAPTDPSPSAWTTLLSLAIAPVVVLGSLILWQQWGAALHVEWIALVLLTCGVATLGWFVAQGAAYRLRSVAIMVGVTQLYFLWHVLMLQGLGVVNGTPLLGLSLWVLACFALLYAVQAAVFFHWLSERDRIYEWIYAGLHLDEWLSRVTRWIWSAPGSAAASR